VNAEVSEFRLRVPLDRLPPDRRGQLKYAAAFAAENVRDVALDGDDLLIVCEPPADERELRSRIERLIDRYAGGEFGFREHVLFRNRGPMPYADDIVAELVRRRALRELGPGLWLFREPVSRLLRFFDDAFVERVARPFGATEEAYPAVISASSLGRTQHFTSFPEHVHFVTHLRADLDVIEAFAETVRRAGDWDGVPETERFGENRALATPALAMNPSVCYHCYEGLQNETIPGEGVAVTAVAKCHRYESLNHRDFGRLLDFTMREVVFVGKPEFVRENRLKAVEYLKQLMIDWELDGAIENANDPFFTNDFQVKASFQRHQEMKYELRLTVPHLGKTIACSSVNFHGSTFGTAFAIRAGKRPATTACVGFGLERWALAFLAQFGPDEDGWPTGFREEYDRWRARRQEPPVGGMTAGDRTADRVTPK